MPRHHETRRLPYSAAQMFALVADVERYPQFLPWNAAARIRARRPVPGGEVIEADLVISFKVFRETFGSRVTLLPEEGRIITEYLDGPFRYLKSSWSFRDLECGGEAGERGGDGAGRGGCEVEFFVDFEFRSAILTRIIGVVFGEAMERIVRAFEVRAHALYG